MGPYRSRVAAIGTCVLVLLGLGGAPGAHAAIGTPVDLTRPEPGVLAGGPERPLDVAVAPDGALSAVWAQRDGTDAVRVRSEHVDADGTRRAVRTLGPPYFPANSPHPTVAVRGNGTAAVAWTRPTSVALLDVTGQPTVVRRLGASAPTMPAVTTAPGGKTIVAGADGSSTVLWVLDATGTTQHRVTLNGSDFASETAVHVASNGTMTVLWALGDTVELATLDADGTVQRRVRVLETSGGSYYRQLALAVDARGVATVAAMHCGNNGAGTPCWSERVDVRQVGLDGTASCLRAAWLGTQEICSSSSYSAANPVVEEHDGDVLVAWSGGPSGGPSQIRVVRLHDGQVVWPGFGLPPIPDPLDPDPSPSAGQAEQTIGDTGQEPRCNPPYEVNGGTFIARTLSSGVDANGRVRLAWCNTPNVFLATLDIATPSAATVQTVSAGGETVSPPQVAADPRTPSAKSAVAWARSLPEAQGDQKVLQVVRPDTTDDPDDRCFTDVTLGVGRSPSTLLSERADTEPAVGPSIAVAGNGRTTAAWRTRTPTNTAMWALRVATTHRRGTPTPEQTLDPGSYFGNQAAAPAIASLGNDRSVVAFGDDHGPCTWSRSTQTARLWAPKR